MKSIVIIIPFFGTLSNTFKFWYQSALNNPTINFLLFTDCCISNAKNIKVIECSFNKFIHDIQSKFDFKINISAPYKLCDFKPAYGDIFQEYIRNYDFWGFGDVDLVYGDIRYFITEDKLNTYDIISGWGHLTLYRNNQYCNNFYKKIYLGFNSIKMYSQIPKIHYLMSIIEKVLEIYGNFFIRIRFGIIGYLMILKFLDTKFIFTRYFTLNILTS